MSTTSKILIGVAAVVLMCGLWIGGSYNGLVSSRAGVKAAFANLEAQYQRRMDLIPNVIETVKGSAKFEQSTLQAVVEARSAWAQAKSTGNTASELTAAQNFDSSLARLLVTVEAYPDLKSTQSFRDLITELEGSENRISVARRDYNISVQTYDVKIQQFPTNMIAAGFGFTKEPFFQADAGAAQAPKVTF